MQNPFGNNGMIPLPQNFATVHNPEKKTIKIGKVGFSITSLLFGCLPSVFRRDWYNLICMLASELVATFIVGLAMNVDLTIAARYVGQFSGIVWGFLYNFMYFRHLQSIGYVPTDQHSKDLLKQKHYMKL